MLPWGATVVVRLVAVEIGGGVPAPGQCGEERALAVGGELLDLVTV